MYLWNETLFIKSQQEYGKQKNEYFFIVYSLFNIHNMHKIYILTNILYNIILQILIMVINLFYYIYYYSYVYMTSFKIVYKYFH